jgi:hypothetical protein
MFEWEYRPGAVWAMDIDLSDLDDENGFDSPEQAAMEGFPKPFVRVESVQYHPDGSHAVVDLLTNEEPHVYPYTAHCVRASSGRWHEVYSHN